MRPALHYELKDILRTRIKEQLTDTLLRNSFTNVVNEMDFTNQIEEVVDGCVSYQLERVMGSMVEEVIGEAVRDAIYNIFKN